jgi:hypothetical protein
VPLEPPASDAPEDLDDLDSMDPDDYQLGPPGGSADYGPGFMPADIPAPGPAEPAGPLPADPKPGKVPRAGKRARAGRGGTAPKITASVRGDIEGKFGLMLQVAGSAWTARDPVCGGAFTAQLPAIRPAAVNLILMSPDLVAWFTGAGGGFMLWFNLLAACAPVAATVWAHHGPGAADDAGAAAGTEQAYAA